MLVQLTLTVLLSGLGAPHVLVFNWKLLNYTNITMGENDMCLPLAKHMSEWKFSPSKLFRLPLDEIKENYVRRNMKDVIFSEVLPTPLTPPLKLVSCSQDVLINILDMHPDISKTDDFVAFVAGNKILPSSRPLAHRYGGHQFGVWAMQLGDGRAHLIGEYINRKGERWELQLKGSGKTPYSRDGDGRAVLRSSIREFLCSEAMYYLGVPTSRAAAIVVSQDPVSRDQFYKGQPQNEKAAAVLRLAPSWFRFGSLELLARNNELFALRALIDFILQEHYPDILLEDENKYLQFFTSVAHKTVDLVVSWQCYGFAHGVLNTDNMSILGITIDYGPFGFLEAYDSQFIPNTSDGSGRYCFDKQLEIVTWNLEKLAQALFPLLDESQKHHLGMILKSINNYARVKLSEVFREKLGLETDNDFDSQLLMLLLQIMEDTGADFTMTFQQLGYVNITDLGDLEVINNFWSLKRMSTSDLYFTFIEGYKKRIQDEPGLTEERRCQNILKKNPRYVLRNWIAQVAIEKAENDDFTFVDKVLNILKNPFTKQEEAEKLGFADPPPKWSYTIRVSCSS